MTSKQIAISVSFGAVWAFFMIMFSSERSIPQIAILAIAGLVVGFAWTWVMKRFGYMVSS